MDRHLRGSTKYDSQTSCKSSISYLRLISDTIALSSLGSSFALTKKPGARLNQQPKLSIFATRQSVPNLLSFPG